jgi:phage tail-like protein
VRGLIESIEDPPFELLNPHPFAAALPGVFQNAWSDERAMTGEEAAFGQRLLGVFDASLAPILASLDNLDAYFDPRTAPRDFLEWLAGWVATSIDHNWEDPQVRDFIAKAADLHRRRGTVAGLREYLAAYIGETVEVTDNGGTAWTTDPKAAPPGSEEPMLTVKVIATRKISRARVEELIIAAKPAAIPHRLEIVSLPSAKGEG